MCGCGLRSEYRIRRLEFLHGQEGFDAVELSIEFVGELIFLGGY